MVLEQVVAAMRGSEARWRSRRAWCNSPGPKEEQKARHTSNAKAVHPPEVDLAKILDGLKDNEHFKDSEELAAMQAKAEQAWGS